MNPPGDGRCGETPNADGEPVVPNREAVPNESVRIPASFNAPPGNSDSVPNTSTASGSTQTPNLARAQHGRNDMTTSSRASAPAANDAEKTNESTAVNTASPGFSGGDRIQQTGGVSTGPHSAPPRSTQGSNSTQGASRFASSRGRFQSLGSNARQSPNYFAQPDSGNRNPAGNPVNHSPRHVPHQNTTVNRGVPAGSGSAPQAHRTSPQVATPRRLSNGPNATEETLVNRLATQNAFAIARARGPPTNPQGSTLAQNAVARAQVPTNPQGSTPTDHRFSPVQRRLSAAEAARQQAMNPRAQASTVAGSSGFPFPTENHVPRGSPGLPSQRESARPNGGVSERILRAAEIPRVPNQPSARPIHARSPARPPSALTDADTTALVRRLLAHDPVDSNQYPILLTPDLIANLAGKIRAVVLKLVNMQSTASSNRPVNVIPEIIDLSADDSEELSRELAETKALLEGERAKVSRLKRSLAEKKAIIEEQAKEATNIQNLSHEERVNASVENLLNKIEEGVVKVEHQKQEIQSMRKVINDDARALKEKDREIEELRKQISDLQKRDNEPPIDTVLEIVQLKDELKSVTETLEEERRNNESTARSYQRAAVNSVKIYNRLQERDLKKQKTKG